METGHIHPAQCQCPVWLLQSKMDLCGDVRLRPGQWVSRLALPRPIWLQHTPVSPILLQDSPHRRLSSYLGSLRWNLDDSLIGNGHGTRRFTLSPNALFLGDSFTGNRAHFVAQEGLPSLTALENPPRLHCTVEADVVWFPD